MILGWDADSSNGPLLGEAEEGPEGALGATIAEGVRLGSPRGASVRDFRIVGHGTEEAGKGARNDTVVGVINVQDKARKGQKTSGGVCDERAALTAATMGTDRQ